MPFQVRDQAPGKNPPMEKKEDGVHPESMFGRPTVSAKKRSAYAIPTIYLNAKDWFELNHVTGKMTPNRFVSRRPTSIPRATFIGRETYVLL